MSCLSALANELTTIARSDAQEARVLALVREYGERDTLTGLLGEILRDEDHLSSEVSRRSYRHPLGFTKYVLLSGLPAYQVRLHVWWPENTYQAEHVHNHRFWFTSMVVLGSLNFEVYEIDWQGVGMSTFIESREASTLAWRFSRGDDTAAALRLSGMFAAGSSYVLRPEVLHRVGATAGQLTATLFVETAPVRSWTTVLVPIGVEAPSPAVKMPLALSECRRGLERVVSAIQPS